MLDFQGARWTIAHEVPEQAGNDHPTSIPTGVFQTSDGYINIASAGDEIFGRFCRAIERPDLAEHPDYKTGRARSDNRKALNAAIEAITRTRTSADWIDRLNKAGVPSGPIYKMDEVFADPQVKHLGIAQKVHHPKLGDIELIGQAVTLEPHAEPAQDREPRCRRTHRRNPRRTRLQRWRHRPGCAKRAWSRPAPGRAGRSGRGARRPEGCRRSR